MQQPEMAQKKIELIMHLGLEKICDSTIHYQVQFITQIYIITRSKTLIQIPQIRKPKSKLAKRPSSHITPI